MKKTKTFNSLRKEERERRKNIILDAAEKLFVSTPSNEVNIRKIAAAAGISPASIYTYFSDQEDLFVELSQRRATHSIEIIKRIVEEHDKDALKKTADAWIDYFTYSMITQFVLQAQLSPKSLKIIAELERNVLDAIEVVLKKNKITGDHRLLSPLFFAAINGIIFMFPGYPGLPEKEAKKFMKLLASTLCDLFVVEKGQD
jgi:AcrR family transcriptional regulator